MNLSRWARPTDTLVTRKMDLPIFQDNLRSSGGWAADLERAGNDWKATSREARARVSELQVAQAILRMSKTGLPDAGNRYRLAAHLVSDWAGKADATLDLDRLKQIHFALSGGTAGTAEFRAGEARRFGPYHDPAPAVILPRLIDNALDWFQTPSFSEIHAVEQAAIVLLRVNDLQPFESLNDETALLCASFFLERAGLPPLILHADEQTISEHTRVLELAFRMLTQPLVEFLSTTLVKTIAQAQV